MEIPNPKPTPADVAAFRAASVSWPRVVHQGRRYAVAPRYVGRVSIGEAKAYAKAYGCVLPSPGLVDAIWRSADCRVDATGLRRSVRGAAMYAPETHAAHEAAVEAELAAWRALHGGEEPDLVAGPYKDVVLAANGKVGLYGFFSADGKAFQPLPVYTGHYDGWEDYSQGWRAVYDDDAPAIDLGGSGKAVSVMKQGDSGTAVSSWQAYLNANGFPDSSGKALVVDGKFGPKSTEATKRFQRAKGLVADGIVGPLTLRAAGIALGGPPQAPTVPEMGAVTVPERKVLDPSLLPIVFVQAKNYTKANRLALDWIVIHTMEVPETSKVAEAVAKNFANQPKAGTILANGKKAKGSSAHYNIDTDSIVQSVHEWDVAWHAEGANAKGVGLEHGGYAKQTLGEWDDAASRAIIDLSARLAADIALRWDIPIVLLTPEDFRAGKRGFIGHHGVVLATGKGDHWDPGPNFPWERYLALVRTYAAARAGALPAV